MDITNQLTTIFCQIDDFCKQLDKHAQHDLLSGPSSPRRGPKSGLAISEIMTILMMFHHVRLRDFKTFYAGYMQRYWHQACPGLPSHSRFISIMKQAIPPMTLFALISQWQTYRYLLYGFKLFAGLPLKAK